MAANFNHQKLRGRSFKGQDLSGSDLRGADLRGIDFTNAVLLHANLSNVNTGLKPTWALYLRACSIVLSVIAAFDVAYASAYFGSMLPEQSPLELALASSFTFVLFLFFIGITLRHGIGKALSGFTVVAITGITFFLALPGSSNNEAILSILFLGIAIAINITGVVTGAIAVAIARILADKRVWSIIILVVPVTIPVGLKAGMLGLSDNWAIMAGIIVAIPILIVLIGLSFYVGIKAIEGNSKYVFVRQIAVAACNYGATNFRGADLTDADFTGANLKYADFRDATLTRTRWSQTKHLAQARTTDTYLENPKIRELVVGLNGQDQNFDHMDLRGLNLQGANLADASFIGTKLSEATLQEVNLARAKLVQTQLYDANLSGACLTGAIIQDWSISSDTNFAAVKCEYIYMQLPTKGDPDPCRKPDNRNETFQDGDFANFIAPIIKTLDLYRTQNVDLRVVAQRFKTLDLFHHEGIDPGAVAIALKQLSEQHPEADIEVVALEGRGDEKVRVQAKVTGIADRSALSAEYFQTYRELSSLPYADLQTLLSGMAEKDERIRSLEKMVTTAIESNRFYVETYYNLGDTVAEKSSSINFNAGGNIGDVSGIVGGDVSGVLNLGTISGNVTNDCFQLPESPKADELGIKDLLQQLQTIIEADSDLPQKGKETALTQVQVLAEVAQNPEEPEKKEMGSQAINLLKGAASFLPDTAKLAEACTKLLPLIGKLLGLPI